MTPTANWGDRGEFRKLTVTLPPEVYDALVQESARRKVAGQPNHLLSAIARECFEHRQPLLPIETTELGIYKAIDGAIDSGSEYFYLPTPNSFQQQTGARSERVLTELLADIAGRGWIQLEKFSAQANQYVPFPEWRGIERFFYEPGQVRMRISIPGRRRKEGLEAKRVATTTTE